MKPLFSSKTKVKLTDREFTMFAVLLIVVEFFLLGNYIVMPKYEEYKKANENYKSKDAQVAFLKQEYNKKDDVIKKTEEASRTVEGLSVELPPYVSQEKIILELNLYAKDSGLIVTGITFGKTETKDVEGFKQSMKQAAPKEQSPNAVTSAVSAVAGAVKQVIGKTEPVPQITGAKVLVSDISLNFSGSYKELETFLGDLEKSARKVFVNNISITAKGEGINGTMKLIYPSYVEPGDKTDYTVDAPEAKGVDSPFLKVEESKDGTTNTAPKEGNAEDKAKSQIKQARPNFYMYINTYDDNASKISFGEYPDYKKTINSEENGLVNAKLTLSGSKDKVTYELELGGLTKKGELQNEIKDGTMVISVISQPRKSEKDKVSVFLDVSNNSDTPIKVDVITDDNKDPRLISGKLSGKVEVSRR